MAADLSRGACAGTADAAFSTDDVFYPEPQRGRPTGDPYAAARAVCARCPITDACLRDALTEPVQWGFRAALTADERQALKGGSEAGKQHRYRLTEAENMERHRLHSMGWTDDQIGQVQGVNATTIKAWRFSNRIPSNVQKHGPHTEYQTKLKWELWEKGYPDKLIGEHVGITSEAVRRWRRREGLVPGPKRQKVPA